MYESDKPEFRIALLYVVASVIWILFSDKLLFDLFAQGDTQSLLSTLKGWFFVVVTGGLLFFFLRKHFKNQREKERSLASLNILLQSVFDSLTEALFILSPVLELQYSNQRAQELFGRSFSAATFWKEFSSFMAADMRILAQEALASDAPVSWELSRPDASWWELRLHTFSGGVTLYIREITESKRGAHREMELQREREELLTQLQMHIDRMPIGYIVSDSSFRIQYLNPTAERMFGYGSDELQGKKPYGYIIPETSREVYEDVYESLRLGRMRAHMTSENVKKSGEALLAEWYNTPILNKEGDFESLVSMVIDVTDRTRALEELRRSEARYRAILEAQSEWIVRCTPVGILTFVNENYAQYHGKTYEAMIGTHFFDSLSTENQSRGNKILADLTREKPTWEGVFEVATADGQLRWHWWSARALVVGEGSIREIQAVGRDITDRKIAEQALRESEARYRILIDRANDGILLLQEGVFVSSNASAARMLAMEPEELVGKRPEELSPDYQPDGTTSIEKATRLIHDSIAGTPQVFEWIHLRKDGGSAMIEVSLTRIELRNHPVLLCFWRDITLRKEAEAELLLSRTRLRALAERLDRVREEERLYLSREIHDGLGQSLTALKIDLSYLKRLRKDETTTPTEEEAALDSMSTLVEQTISQARHLAWQIRPGMLDQLGLADALRQLAHDATKRNELKLIDRIEDLECDLDPRTALALYRIAQEAMTNILRHANAKHISISLRQEATGIRLEIDDDGVGIGQKDLEEISSMGLISMRERAELLGGSISVQSGESGGTNVRAIVPYPDSEK